MSDDPITASSAGINDTIPSGPLQGKDGEGTGSNTTIHTERYTAWKGTLENRRNIVGRTIHQGFRHILSNKWVKILIVLTWIFNVVFPLLFAFFGMNNLMQSSGDENVYGEENDPYEIIKSYDVGFPLSKTIKPRETAVYPISVINAGEKTDIVHVWISYQDEGWSA